MSWLLNRLREPSTWRGIIWLLTVAGWSLRPDQAEAIVTFGVTLVGLIGVFLPDPKPQPALPPRVALPSPAGGREAGGEGAAPPSPAGGRGVGGEGAEIPPIEWQSHVENDPDFSDHDPDFSDRRAADHAAGAEPDRLRLPLTLPAQYPPEHDQRGERAGGPGWNG